VLLRKAMRRDVSRNIGNRLFNNRPYCPVFNITSKQNIAVYFSILRGIFTILYEDVNNIDGVITFATDFLLTNKLIAGNTNIVLLSGLNEKKNGTTDQMRVITIPEYTSNSNSKN
jgi:pyruvate kinase